MSARGTAQSFAGGFVSGFRALAEGLGVITEPGMRRYTLLPLLLSVMAFVALLVIAIHYFGGLVGLIEGHLPGWLAWTAWLLWIGLAAVFVFGFYWGFTFVVGLVGLPFFILLANAVERRQTGRLPETRRGMLYLIAAGTVRQFPRLGYLALWMLAVFAATIVLGLIPLVNALVAPLWFLFGAWSLAVMMSDFPLGARNFTWKHQHDLIRGHRGRVMGFGVACAAMALVPVLNLVLLPAATAGVTLLWVEVLEPEAAAAQRAGAD